MSHKRNSNNCFTGANATPLGPRNKAIGAKRGFSSEPPKQPSPPPRQPVLSTKAQMGLAAAQAAAAKLAKRVAANPYPEAPAQQISQDNNIEQSNTANSNTQNDRGRPRKKRSRWSTPEIKTEIPGIPTVMPANLNAAQQRAYILQLQIEDINRKLKSGNLGIPANPEDRSPSPEPIYGNDGKRLNTREYRTRKRLEEDRHKYIAEMQDLNPEFKPPMDYKPPMQRVSERVMIPQDENPLINFVGLLIGPRGNTLKRIEKDSTCKIMIRGKGSVKEGKIGRKDGQPLPGEDEPLHALVSSSTIENVQKAVKEIQKIIKEGIEQPEGQNDLRKLQLMELARLNGTLRDENMPREREWLRPENQNITNTTVCTKCGGRGHLEQDCRAPRPSMGLQNEEGGDNPAASVDRAKMDSEYMSLMAELGEGPPSGKGSNNGPSGNMGGGNMGSRMRPPAPGAQAPPWMGNNRGGGRFNGPNNGGRYGNPGNYNNQGNNMMGNNRANAPWMQGNMGYGGQGGYGQNNYNQMGPGGNDGYGGGNMPWQNQMGGPPMPFNSMAPPPPPPPSAPQQPPLPSDDNQSGMNSDNPPPGPPQGNSGMMRGGYGMWGGPGGGMNQPPMPSGPRPMPPPPPSGNGPNSNSGPGNQSRGGMGGYNNMMGMMGFGMQPAPPPPPPQ